MKQYILRFNQHNPDSVYSFKALKNGSKKVETRAASKKYRHIKIGDMLVFVCGNKKFKRKIRKVKFFKSINAMLKIYCVKDIMPDRTSKESLKKAYNSYMGYKDKIKKFGIVAIEV